MKLKYLVLSIGLIFSIISGVLGTRDLTKENKTSDLESNVIEVAKTENLVSEDTNTVQDETTEKTEKTEEKKQENKMSNENKEIQKNKQENSKENTSSKVIKTQEIKEKGNIQNTTCNVENVSTKKVDLSKYSYYEKASDGSFKAFIVDNTEINKLKGLIDNAIRNFGYKNIRVTVDSSLSKDGTMYFTANRTNVENLVYDSEGFNIHYYAIKEYFISPNGTEKYFQTRSYIKVK